MNIFHRSIYRFASSLKNLLFMKYEERKSPFRQKSKSSTKSPSMVERLIQLVQVSYIYLFSYHYWSAITRNGLMVDMAQVSYYKGTNFLRFFFSIIMRNEWLKYENINDNNDIYYRDESFFLDLQK